MESGLVWYQCQLLQPTVATPDTVRKWWTINIRINTVASVEIWGRKVSFAKREEGREAMRRRGREKEEIFIPHFQFVISVIPVKFTPRTWWHTPPALWPQFSRTPLSLTLPHSGNSYRHTSLKVSQVQSNHLNLNYMGMILDNLFHVLLSTCNEAIVG